MTPKIERIIKQTKIDAKKFNSNSDELRHDFFKLIDAGGLEVTKFITLTEYLKHLELDYESSSTPMRLFNAAQAECILNLRPGEHKYSVLDALPSTNADLDKMSIYWSEAIKEAKRQGKTLLRQPL